MNLRGRHQAGALASVGIFNKPGARWGHPAYRVEMGRVVGRVSSRGVFRELGGLRVLI